MCTDNYSDLIINTKANIGSGMFGSVFKATYKSYPCAAKVLVLHALQIATDLPTGDNVPIEAQNAFDKECDFLQSLIHKNIVKHIATLTQPGSKHPILVMELMHNSLKGYLLDNKENEIPMLHQISLCCDIAKALTYIHSRDIIHRDLCDDNILLKIAGAMPQAKISDFGMSTILPQDMSATLTGLCHRQVYFPPEVREVPYHYHSSVDIYSFGVIGIQIVQNKTHLKMSDLDPLYNNIPEVHLMKKTIHMCDLDPLYNNIPEVLMKKTIHMCIFNDKNNRPKAADIAEKLSQDCNTIS